jgi:uncharacterized protein (DUF2062 family)
MGVRKKSGPGWWRWLKYHYLRVLRLNDTPEKVAAGLSLGVVLGILPTFGLGIIIAAFIAGLFKVNKASAIIGTLVMNPWTSPFFWALSYLTGAFVLGEDLRTTLHFVRSLKDHADIWKSLLTQRVILPYIVGNAIVTIGAAATAYIAGLYIVRGYKKAKMRRLRRQASDHEFS